MNNSNLRIVNQKIEWTITNPKLVDDFECCASAIIRDSLGSPIMTVELKHSGEAATVKYFTYCIYPVVKFSGRYYKVKHPVFNNVIEASNANKSGFSSVPSFLRSLEYLTDTIQNLMVDMAEDGNSWTVCRHTSYEEYHPIFEYFNSYAPVYESNDIVSVIKFTDSDSGEEHDIQIAMGRQIFINHSTEIYVKARHFVGGDLRKVRLKVEEVK